MWFDQDVISGPGEWQWRYTYEPFGVATGTKVNNQAPANPATFTGEYQDAPRGG